MKLRFVEETHDYFLGKTRLPSVTEVIEGVGLVKGAQWFRENHRERGHNVHLAIRYESDGTLDRASLSPEIAGYLSGWESFRAASGFASVHVEEPLCHPDELWAGTPDHVGLMGGDWWVIDVKSGAFSKEHLVQAAAYAVLAKLAYDLPTCRAAVLAVTKDGGYKLHGAAARHRTVWYAALTLYRFKGGT